MIEIRALKDVPGAVAPLAAAFHAEWPGSTLQSVENQFRGFAQNEGVPMVLVALEDGEVVGAVGLLEHSEPSRPDLSPWVAALYVWPQQRRHGLGSQLILAAEAAASALGFGLVYASTYTAVSLFSRLDWEIIDAAEESGNHYSIMRKQLGTQPLAAADATHATS